MLIKGTAERCKLQPTEHTYLPDSIGHLFRQEEGRRYRQTAGFRIGLLYFLAGTGKQFIDFSTSDKFHCYLALADVILWSLNRT